MITKEMVQKHSSLNWCVNLNRGSGKEVSQVATIVCGYPASTEILGNKYSIISVTKYFWNLMQA